ANADSDTVSIPVTITKPTYTDEQYKSMIFRDVLSSQSTSFNGNQVSRTSNIRIAAKDCETVIMPGEEFSYTEQVGKITREKGYQDALVFSQGEVVDGLGGGVCQVSSTIYMAAMYADMEITVRRNHSFVVSYTPVGQDATFVYGGQDFKFRNNTNFPIKVETAVGKSTITVKIIGTQETPGKSVKVITEILSTNPYEEQHVYDPTLAPNEVKVKNVGYTGYKANTYRIIYIDGVEVSKTHEATSTYKRLDKVTLYGTDPNAPVVETPTEAPTEAPTVAPVETPTEAPATEAPAEDTTAAE
ncbi:MAG: VanW family protein, partial [Clostridia bacterium]|nr:VanW family protein [Clostridia bacterium]